MNRGDGVNELAQALAERQGLSYEEAVGWSEAVWEVIEERLIARAGQLGLGRLGRLVLSDDDPRAATLHLAWERPRAGLDDTHLGEPTDTVILSDSDDEVATGKGEGRGDAGGS